MKVSNKINGLFHRQPRNDEELVSRAEAERSGEQARQAAAEINLHEGANLLVALAAAVMWD